MDRFQLQSGLWMFPLTVSAYRVARCSMEMDLMLQMLTTITSLDGAGSLMCMENVQSLSSDLLGFVS